MDIPETADELEPPGDRQAPKRLKVRRGITHARKVGPARHDRKEDMMRSRRPSLLARESSKSGGVTAAILDRLASATIVIRQALGIPTIA